MYCFPDYYYYFFIQCVVGGCNASFASQGGLARHVPTHFSQQNSSKVSSQPKAKEESPSKAGMNKRRKLKNKRRRSLRKYSVHTERQCVSDGLVFILDSHANSISTILQLCLSVFVHSNEQIGSWAVPVRIQMYVLSLVAKGAVYVDLRTIVILNGEGHGTHPSALAWKIPWTEEPGGLQSMGSLRVGHD